MFLTQWHKARRFMEGFIAPCANAEVTNARVTSVRAGSTHRVCWRAANAQGHPRGWIRLNFRAGEQKGQNSKAAAYRLVFFNANMSAK